jgi:hypothetical protein
MCKALIFIIFALLLFLLPKEVYAAECCNSNSDCCWGTKTGTCSCPTSLTPCSDGNEDRVCSVAGNAVPKVCSYSNVRCVKGSCGAECDSNDDCASNECRQDCTCRPSEDGRGGRRCSDDCSLNGVQYRCSDNTIQIRTCGYYDSDPCLDWSSWQDVRSCNGTIEDCYCQNAECKPCGLGEVCRNYQCQPGLTFYFRGDNHTVNGLEAYKLLDTQSNIEKKSLVVSGPDHGNFGIRVWNRSSSGNETEIADGLCGVWYDDWCYRYCGESGVWGNIIAKMIHPTIDFTNINPAGRGDYYSGRITGYIYAPYTGTYTFYLTTDDGAKLWINNTKVIDWWEIGSKTVSGSIYLERGFYPIKIEHFEYIGNERLLLEWSFPGKISRQKISAEYLKCFAEPGITSPSPTAIVSAYFYDVVNRGYHYYSASWHRPPLELAPLDSVVVRVYGYGVASGDTEAKWRLLANFSTPQLGVNSLSASTWKVIYYIEAFRGGVGEYAYNYRFSWGTGEKNSRIENFGQFPVCNNNNICDPGETQACSDCKTFASILPNYTYPGQEVTIMIYFNDSRFNVSKSDYDVKFDLFISNIAWNSTNGCDIGGKKLRAEMNCECGMGGCREKYGHYESSKYWITLVDGYANLTAICKIPTTLKPGFYTLKAIPTIYSSPIVLTSAEAQFIVGDSLHTFTIIVKSIFNRLTGFFIRP